MNHAVLPRTVAGKMLNPVGRMTYLGSACVAMLLGLLSLDAQADTPLNERLGVAHVNGTYHLTNDDFLNEGADQVLKLGSRVIKVYLTWEGDWAVRGAFDPKIDPADSALDNMTRWLNARQRGVEHARAELRADGVHVWHAVEVNLVLPSFQQHRPGVIDRVIPRVRPDLVSYGDVLSSSTGRSTATRPYISP
ncbi:MAG: hypothetical protein ACHRXM_18755 [Isosphaerales bacterium]